MYTCQCKGWQRGQTHGFVLKDVTAFRRCPLIEVSRGATQENRDTSAIRTFLVVPKVSALYTLHSSVLSSIYGYPG